MRSCSLKSFSIFRALVLCAGLLYALGGVAGESEPQNSEANGVSISVKPLDVSAAAATWQFQLALNTHSGALDDDLTRTATLVDAAGKPHAAAGWDGDAPGGHHRKGVLRFNALSPRPGTLEMRIERTGEAAPRTFRWTLK